MTLADPRKVLEEANREKKSEDGDDGLPPITKIHLDVVGTRGKRYQHTFVYKVPNLGDQVKMAQLKANYLPLGAAADLNGFSIVEQIAYLTVTLDPKHLPDWWDVWNLYDGTPLSALYKEVTDYERRFHGSSKAGGDVRGGEELARENGSDRRGSGEADDADVVEEAPAPPQRRKTLATSSR